MSTDAQYVRRIAEQVAKDLLEHTLGRIIGEAKANGQESISVANLEYARDLIGVELE